jgi:hypothetical protein
MKINRFRGGPNEVCMLALGITSFIDKKDNLILWELTI